MRAWPPPASGPRLTAPPTVAETVIVVEGACPHCGLHGPAIKSMLHLILNDLEKIMTAQDSINAAVATFSAFFADLVTATADIKAELASQGVTVDTSALDALVAQVPAVQASVDALEAPAPAPAPSPSS